MTAAELATRLGLPRVELLQSVGSTLDVAHELAAAGAPAGTLVVADTQTSGRGRMGRTWTSEAGAGLWLTVIERPGSAGAIDVLSLRIGIRLAPVLDRFATSRIQLKWPNDLYLDGRKLGGILIEARWRDRLPDWIAIGVGINLRPPAGERRAVGLGSSIGRDDLLTAVVPAIRDAAAQTGALTKNELDAFADRDMAAGRRCVQPMGGMVNGITPDGSLRIGVISSGGRNEVAVRSGSLVLQGEE